MLVIVSVFFFRMINLRFGDNRFVAAKMRLRVVIVFFSISFLIRSCWDFTIEFREVSVDAGLNALIIFLVYFFTEFMPIFTIYFMHADGINRMKKMKDRKVKLSSLVNRSDDSYEGISGNPVSLTNTELIE